ncbi:hypothetical protein DEV91_108194 [Phyllobacterium brassicacearum]|nr:hypothetical protein DEV91_108194 [Phyllobacterium brassicacearum]
MQSREMRKHTMDKPIRVYFGIDPSTLTVEHWLARNRHLIGMHAGNPVCHYVMPTSDAESELRTAYRLTNIVALRPMASLWETEQVKNLEGKAEALRTGQAADDA